MRNRGLLRLYLQLLCFLLSGTAFPQIQKIYLNPKATGIAKQADYIDSIRFIPLETRKDLPYDFFASLQVTDKYFLLIRRIDKELIVYSRDGKYLRTISYKRLGADFSPDYREASDHVVFFGYNSNYTLTSKDRIKITIDWNRPRNRKYFKKYVIDLKDPASTLQKATPSQYDVIKAAPLYDDYYFSGRINTSELYKDSLDYELKIFSNNQLVKGYFPYNRVNEPRFKYVEVSDILSPTGSLYERFITRPYCDTIYKLVKTDLFPAYRIVFPLENSLPPSFYTIPFKNKAEKENFSRSNGWMLNEVYTVYETPRFIYMLIGYLANVATYIYEKKTNTTTAVKNIKPDKSQYNLPLLRDFGLSKKGNRFYRILKADDLLSFSKSNKDVRLPEYLQDFLKTNPDANAPLIVEFKLKD